LPTTDSTWDGGGGGVSPPPLPTERYDAADDVLVVLVVVDDVDDGDDGDFGDTFVRLIIRVGC